MLQHIVGFAYNNIPHLQPGFGPKRAKWRISINPNGTSVVEPYGSGEDGGELEMCPEYPSNLLQGGGRCHFLVETLQVMPHHGTQGTYPLWTFHCQGLH